MESVPVFSEESLSTSAALELVTPFFEHEWPQILPEHLHMEKVTGGFVNRLYKLTRTTNAVREPSSVFIRFFGLGGTDTEPLERSTTLSVPEQALIYYEMGRRGWGPKLYGTFPGGRIEEYITSHPLTPAESIDPTIRRDIARSYARLHSLDLPLRKSNFRSVLAEFSAAASDMDDLVKDVASDNSTAVKFKITLDTLDLKNELEWVADAFKRYECKSAIAISDGNFLNLLVKDYESECRVMLIDYETATYGYRGIDIGGHWNERMYQWSDPQSQLTGYPLPDYEDRRAFCEAYRDELGKLSNGVLELDARDTVDHLMLEGDIGQLFQILFSIMMCLMFGSSAALDKLLLEALTKCVESYHTLKSDFEAGHGPKR